MRSRLSIPPLERYVLVVIAAGVAALAITVLQDRDALSALATREVILFACCALIGELVPLKVVTRGVEGEVTTSTTFAFATLLAAGPAPAVVVLVAGSFIADGLRRKAPLKLLFNGCQYALTMALAALALHLLTGVPRTTGTFHFTPGDLPGILVSAGVFFLVNSALVATWCRTASSRSRPPA
jgi:hypothetical protein